jgi:hypothetical protein
MFFVVIFYILKILGDGGGGLYYRDPTVSNRYVTVGIVSYRVGCARVEIPS